ncbi:MAG: rod shape-determining protein MreD [Planctomycetota bacterium]
MSRAALIPLAAAFAFQIAALPLYRVGPAGPDFVLAVLLYLGIHDGTRRSLAAAAASGCLLDFVSIEPFGVFALGYLAALGAARSCRRALSGPGSRDPAPSVRAVSAALGVLAATLARVALSDEGASRALLGSLGSAAYTAALAPIVFALLAPSRTRLLEEPIPGRRRGWSFG